MTASAPLRLSNAAAADDVRRIRHARDRLQVVVAGAGPAGLEAVLTLAERAREMVDVTLVANRDDFVFRPRALGEAFGRERPHRLSLRDVARHTGVTFRRAWVTGVDVESRQLLLAGDERIAFDALLLALGARSLPAYPAFTTWRDNDADALAGLVRELEGVWAAGDGIAFAIKHGGLAAQQANVAALAIAAIAGADVEVKSFRPVLRTEARSADRDTSSGELWWPPGDAVGDRLAAYLANHGAGPWLRPRSTSPRGDARELRDRGRRRARQER